VSERDYLSMLESRLRGKKESIEAKLNEEYQKLLSSRLSQLEEVKRKILRE